MNKLLIEYNNLINSNTNSNTNSITRYKIYLGKKLFDDCFYTNINKRCFEVCFQNIKDKNNYKSIDKVTGRQKVSEDTVSSVSWKYDNTILIETISLEYNKYNINFSINYDDKFVNEISIEIKDKDINSIEIINIVNEINDIIVNY